MAICLCAELCTGTAGSNSWLWASVWAGPESVLGPMWAWSCWTCCWGLTCSGFNLGSDLLLVPDGFRSWAYAYNPEWVVLHQLIDLTRSIFGCFQMVPMFSNHAKTCQLCHAGFLLLEAYFFLAQFFGVHDMSQFNYFF